MHKALQGIINQARPTYYEAAAFDKIAILTASSRVLWNLFGAVAKRYCHGASTDV